jgi:ABC-type sugar transport system permease subunit
MGPSDSTDSAPDRVRKPSSGPRVSSSGRQSTFQLAPYLFLIPTVGILFLFSVFPMFYGFWMSLQNFDVIRGTVKFVGSGNYLQLFHDPQFGLSVLNTAWYTFTFVALIVTGSIAIAVFLRKSRPARLLARVGFYIPFVLSPVVVATSWKWLLNEDLGVIDGFLKWAGVSTIPWLTDDFSARLCVVAITVWNLVGFYMLMVLAGLSQIRAELYEAARIEGGSGFGGLLCRC